MKFFTDLFYDLVEHYQYLSDQISFKNYAYIDLEDPTPSIPLILLGIFAGIALGAIIAVYHKKTLGKFISALIKQEAFDTHSAKTLAELGAESIPGIRRALNSRTSAIRKLVRFVGDDEESADNEGVSLVMRDRFNFKETRFYIPEQLKYRADVRSETGGTSWSIALLIVVCCTAAYLALIEALPYILSFIDYLMS